jgi:hypothetical protein
MPAPISAIREKGRIGTVKRLRASGFRKYKYRSWKPGIGAKPDSANRFMLAAPVDAAELPLDPDATHAASAFFICRLHDCPVRDAREKTWPFFAIHIWSFLLIDVRTNPEAR